MLSRLQEKTNMVIVSRREFLRLAGTAPVSLPLLASSCQTNIPLPPQTINADPRLEINLNHIAWNIKQIRNRVNNIPVMAVIKANAYGHGIVGIGKHLEKQKVEYLAVGKVVEAIQLRECGVKTPILNFGPFAQVDMERLITENISQSVFTDQVSLLAKAADGLGKIAKVHIKIDTGLGRVGVPYNVAMSFIEKVASMSRIHIEGIFTSFTEDEEFDKIQYERFLQICRDAKNRGIDVGLRHAASSATMLSYPDAYLDMVRPGITIYGEYPSVSEYRQRKIDLKPALTLKTYVMYVKKLQQGESVSYHRKFMAREDTFVATLPVGYSDGFPYGVADKGDVLINGKRWPIIASVTANHTTVNVTGTRGLAVGDEVVLLGEQENNKINAEEIAAWTGTSVYKIVIGMNPLLRRIFIE
jgi:alanine racemase